MTFFNLFQAVPKDDDLLKELRNHWRHTIEDEGGQCPVCDRWGRVYARALNRTMAHAIIWICNQDGDKDGWVDVPVSGPTWLLRSNQLSSLRWWDLVERKENVNLKNKFSGLWRPTALGKSFAKGNAKVPKKVFTYKGEVEGTSNETVEIGDCFEDTFDYQEIMSKYPPKD